MKEILANEKVVNAFVALDINFKAEYTGNMYYVFEINDEDFEKLSNFPETKWKLSWGWWRSAEGSNLNSDNLVDFTINRVKVKAFYDEQKLLEEKHFYLGDNEILSQEDIEAMRTYNSLITYLSEELGISLEKNVCAVAMDIAKANGWTLGETFTKLQGVEEY